jgi:hypothetical protein
VSDRAADPANDHDAEELTPAQCLVVRVGHGANCSSVGSVIDTLFLGATVGGAILAAVCAAMKSEEVRVVGLGRPKVASTPHAPAERDEESPP